MTVSVVIPTRDLSERLDRCLDTLSRQSVKPLEIMLICTGAAQPAGIQRRWPGIHVIAPPTPVSFCRAVNLGIAAATGTWLLLLNDDVVLTPRFLEQLLGAIPADEHIGMVCGKLLAMDGRTIDSTGQFVSRACTAVERGHGETDGGQYDVPGYVFSVPGAAGLYRRRMLEDLAVDGQYFDERLGMYLEDLDMGFHAQRAGWRAYYVPEAVGTHARGATAKTHRPSWGWLARYYLPWLAPELQARYVLNRYTLIRRYASLGGLLRDSPWILWYELRLWGYLLGLNWATLRLIGKAWWDALGRGLALRACGILVADDEPPELLQPPPRELRAESPRHRSVP